MSAKTHEERLTYMKEWRKQNSTTETRRDRAYRMRYGITLSEYNAMVESRGGKCDICGRIPVGKKWCSRLAVDHDHDTGSIRGLLCTACNVAVGQIEHELYKKRLAYVIAGGKNDGK